jgi:HTH-type transcriptional regulator, bacterioopsin transcriptional activator and related proteins
VGEPIEIEDDPMDAQLIEEMLKPAPWEPGEPSDFELTRVEQLSEALRTLALQTFDVVLLDLDLPDSKGLETLARVLEPAQGRVPIVVLTAYDEVIGLEAVRRGARDFLAKTGLGTELLARTLRYTAERHRAQEVLLESEARHRRLTEADLLQATALASAANQVLVRAGSEVELLEKTCRTIVDLGGYRLAWVGLAQEREPDGLSLGRPTRAPKGRFWRPRRPSASAPRRTRDQSASRFAPVSPSCARTCARTRGPARVVTRP